MRKLFLVLAVALTGCYYQRFEVTPAPRPAAAAEAFPTCPKVPDTDADAVMFVNRMGGVTHEIWLIEGAYYDSQLIRVEGPTRYLMVPPTCTFKIGRPYGEPPVATTYTTGGFEPYRIRTVIVASYDAFGLLDLRSYQIPFGEQPFGYRYDYYTLLGTPTFRLVNYVYEISSPPPRQFFGGGNNIKIQFDPAYFLNKLRRDP